MSIKLNSTPRVLNVKSGFEENIFEHAGLYSFLNFASLGDFFRDTENTEITYFCDGILMALLTSFLSGEKVNRVSFDYTSIAKEVFLYAQKNNKRITFIGATQEQLLNFQNKLKVMHPALDIVASHNGYFDDKVSSEIFSKLLEQKTDILIVGLGAGLQEKFITKAKLRGFTGVAFSCGGFIRQEAASNHEYYPPTINKLNLRAFFRMYKEPHTIKRYFFSYPKNVFIYLFLFFRKKLVINVNV